MKSSTFDPDLNGLAVWPQSCAAAATFALDLLSTELKSRHPDASLVPGGSAIYALRDDVVVGVAWVEPDIVDGRVVGVRRFIGPLATRA